LFRVVLGLLGFRAGRRLGARVVGVLAIVLALPHDIGAERAGSLLAGEAAIDSVRGGLVGLVIIRLAPLPLVLFAILDVLVHRPRSPCVPASSVATA
jgi:hypothetical protein